MSTKIKPLAEYVLAEQEEAQSKTASGIFLPEGQQKEGKVALVLEVGNKVKEVKKGDKVIFGGYSHSDVKVDGKEYLLIKEEDIYAVIK